MQKFNFYVPRIEFGSGRLKELGELCKRFGNKAFLAIDPNLDKIGVADEVIKNLKKSSIETVKFTEIEPNPSCFAVDRGGEVARKAGSQFVIGLGGGSSMDLGKGVAVLANHPGPSWQYTERTDHEVLRPNAAKMLPIVCIPTTSGTGSEVSPFAVFNNPKVKAKATLRSDLVIPTLSLVDPELTISLPPQGTAYTGIDALAHAIESYYGLAATPVSKAMSLEAIRLGFIYLPQAFANGKNLEAREQMAWACILAGVGLAHGIIALPHALGQPVGGIFGAPHGGTLAACLIKCLEITIPADIKSFAEVAEAMDPDVRSLPLRARAEKVPELMERLYKDVNCKAKFSDWGMKESDIDRVTDLALTAYGYDMKLNPRQVTVEEVKEIYRQCI